MKRPDALPVGWTQAAVMDLGEIAARIAHDNPDSAASAADRIERRAASLASHSLRGRVAPELSAQGIYQYRELIVAPWRLAYRVESKRVLIIAVFDGRRNMEELLLNRLLATPDDETDPEAA